jgi:hypothetical protein
MASSATSALDTKLSDVEPGMVEQLKQLVVLEPPGQLLEDGEEPALAYLLVQEPTGAERVIAVSEDDLPEHPGPLPVQTMLRIQQLVEAIRPVTLGIVWPAMTSETEGMVYLFIRNIWDEVSIRAFSFDGNRENLLEEVETDGIGPRFITEFQRIYMAWSRLSQVRFVPDIEAWAQACLAAEPADPCPCGSGVIYENCCSGHQLNPQAYQSK